MQCSVLGAASEPVRLGGTLRYLREQNNAAETNFPNNRLSGKSEGS
jgi:hypothetical protein